MIIYPDIEIRKGKCVSLRKGRFEDPLVYDIDPQTAAKNFESEGAEWLHVVDMDSVFNDGENRELVEGIVDDVNIPVQVSGGIRTLSQIDKWLEFGAARVCIRHGRGNRSNFNSRCLRPASRQDCGKYRR